MSPGSLGAGFLNEGTMLKPNQIITVELLKFEIEGILVEQTFETTFRNYADIQKKTAFVSGLPYPVKTKRIKHARK